MANNKFEIEGVIESRGETQQKTDNFKIRKFVLGVNEQVNEKTYYNSIEFQLMQAKTDLINDVRAGDKVKVTFNLRGKNTDKYGNITNLVAFQVDVLERNNQEGTPDPSNNELPHEQNNNEVPDDGGDLPF